MTVLTLPPLPRTVPVLACDASAVRECGADLLAASAQVDDLGTFVAGAARVPDWRGEGSSAYHAAIAPTGARAEAMSLALRSVARRIDAHADELRALVARRTDLEERRGRLVQQVTWLRSTVAGAGASAVDAVGLRAEADDLTAQVRDFEEDLDLWAVDLDAEESEMNQAFTRVLAVSDVERIYGGVEDPADAALATKPGRSASPADVNAWWGSLTAAQQQAIVAAAPGAIGTLDGIPPWARDASNTVALDRDLADWGHAERKGVLTRDERTWLENARAADEARRNIGDRVDPVTGLPIQTQVHTYDPTAFDGDGAIAIAAGSLDTADNVAIIVPGFGTDAESAGYLGHRAATLYESTRFLDPGATNATMFWIGYDAPDNAPWDEGWDGAGVAGECMASAGGGRLADTIDGLRASHEGEPSHVTVIGHSYGSTTTGHAAHDHGLPVEDLVFLGSPGVGGDTDGVADTGVAPDHVWAGANSRDPIADLGNHGWVHGETGLGAGLGDDPAEDDFGAQRFEAESTSRGGAFSFGEHSTYFDHDTESLYNVSQVVNAHYDAVQHAAHVTDPWFGGVKDPEHDRQPSSPATR